MGLSRASYSSVLMNSSEEELKILDCIDDDTPTEFRVTEAKARLAFFSFLRLMKIPETKIDSHKLLSAMLEHAPTERGRRYVACAIVCCGFHIPALLQLASDWLKLFLWPFKSAYRSSTASSSAHSTPTLNPTVFIPVHRDSNFAKQVRKRQADRCAVINDEPSCMVTVAAHIIRRSIVQADNSAAGVHPSLFATWDILKHYADLSDEMIENLEHTIDSPRNGILIDSSMHFYFDNFRYYFEPLDVPNTYQVKWLTVPFYGFRLQGHKTVTFENRSYEPIDHPDPKFLMIHATIAKVLHTSGAGEYFDHVINSFHPAAAPFSWKFGGPDLDLRLSVLSLAGQSP